MKMLATLGPIGYLPASGTWASLLTVFFVYGLHMLYISWLHYSFTLIAIMVMGFYAVSKSLQFFKHTDPREIVIDEVVGCLITFWLIPFSFTTALIGFALFRFFDITKILGLTWLERQGAIAGIMLDDIGAGILSNIVLRALLRLLVDV